MSDRQPDSKEKIQEAWKKVWECAVNIKHHTLMEIPPNEDRDADLIMRRALNELFELREENATLRHKLAPTEANDQRN
jgi:hypothetical protein